MNNRITTRNWNNIYKTGDHLPDSRLYHVGIAQDLQRFCRQLNTCRYRLSHWSQEYNTDLNFHLFFREENTKKMVAVMKSIAL